MEFPKRLLLSYFPLTLIKLSFFFNPYEFAPFHLFLFLNIAPLKNFF